MSFTLRSLILFAAITCTAGQMAEGQIVRRAFSEIFCPKCRQYDCTCAPPVAPPQPAKCCVPPPKKRVGGPVAKSCTKTCTTVHPVVETRYRRENYMTCRTECRTAYRREAYCETVPTTCIENVTRDEGHYKMVWVPKPVTRQVARTIYKKRMRHRKVPYQYTVKVPEMKCRVVPEKRVRYVQKTHTFREPMKPVGCAAPLPQPITTPGCAAPHRGAPGLRPRGTSSTPAAQTPETSSSRPSTHNGTSWTKVPKRVKARQAQGTNYLPVSKAAQQRQSAARTPSAAAVWQTQ